MPIAHHAILTSNEMLSADPVHLSQRWIDVKERSRNLRIPDAIDDRLGLAHGSSRTTPLHHLATARIDIATSLAQAAQAAVT